MSFLAPIRLGGISGILFVALVIPSFLSAPDTPVATSESQDVIDYFNDRQDGILTNNGLLLVFAAFFFLWFLGMLYSVLRGAESEGHGFSPAALAGGVLFIALILAGAAVEIVYPATLARFENFQEDAQLGYLSLALSGWMYRFAFVGMSALIAATSLVVLRTGVLPGWVAWVGFVAALAALLRLLGPLGAWLALLWVAAFSVLMIVGAIRGLRHPANCWGRYSHESVLWQGRLGCCGPGSFEASAPFVFLKTIVSRLSCR